MTNVDRELWALLPGLAPAWYDPEMSVEEMLTAMAAEQTEKVVESDQP